MRLPTQPLAALTAGQSADIVRLLWRDHSARRLKPDVVDVDMARDYCARMGGISLLGRRAALDIHGCEDESALADFDSGLPPRSAVPFLVTVELLLIERAVLLQLYERLSQRTPASIATWHYRTELGAVLAWTLGAAVASAGVLVALLSQHIEKR